ncbi:MAG: hypothetical protein PHS92_02080 [Candidatus Gracilibacteria bacterium]|nr:hypothetical protein [Candidatus Gracilibacteria bacterium]
MSKNTILFDGGKLTVTNISSVNEKDETFEYIEIQNIKTKNGQAIIQKITLSVDRFVDMVKKLNIVINPKSV